MLVMMMMMMMMRMIVKQMMMMMRMIVKQMMMMLIDVDSNPVKVWKHCRLRCHDQRPCAKIPNNQGSLKRKYLNIYKLNSGVKMRKVETEIE